MLKLQGGMLSTRPAAGVYNEWLDARRGYRGQSTPLPPVPAQRLSLLIAIGDATAGEVVRRQLHRDLVARENADVVHTNLAGDRAENGHTVLQLNAKHGVGQRLSDRTFKFDGVFLLHVHHLSLENDSNIACYYM